MNLLLALSAALLFFTSAQAAPAAETNTAVAELTTLIANIQTKLNEGKSTEADLTDEIKGFDALLAKHKGETNDAVAEILFKKAVLYQQVFRKESNSTELMAQLKHDFPNSTRAKMLKKQEEAQKLRATLVVGSPFPNFEERDLAGNPLSVAKYKGKVVLIDFWATWCGPCVGELPNVLKTYEKHHAQGFEIIGVSLDQDEKKLTSFTKQKNMPWPQFFDGNGWENKLASTYGIQSIPATFLLDAEGKIIGEDLHGEDLEDAVAKALAKN